MGMVEDHHTVRGVAVGVGTRRSRMSSSTPPRDFRSCGPSISFSASFSLSSSSSSGCTGNHCPRDAFPAGVALVARGGGEKGSASDTTHVTCSSDGYGKGEAPLAGGTRCPRGLEAPASAAPSPSSSGGGGNVKDGGDGGGGVYNSAGALK